MAERSYLGVPLVRPRIGVFDFTSCEGCELQLLNNESTLLDFLSLVEVVNFREAMTPSNGGSNDYDIAFIEGSISRADEVERLAAIRSRAKVLVALGSCAVFGGVNQLKNRFGDIEWVKRQVYAEHPIDTMEVKPLEAYVKVDLSIYGCPVKKEEVERLVLNLCLGKSLNVPSYPVCVECKANENICLFDLGEPCLGPVTRAGCDSWCPNGRAGCWGCRGPADAANVEQLIKNMLMRGIQTEAIMDRLECFGGFAEDAKRLREEIKGALK